MWRNCEGSEAATLPEESTRAYSGAMKSLMLGKLHVSGRRDDVVLATKSGNERQADGSMVGFNGRSGYVRSACGAPNGAAVGERYPSMASIDS